MQPTSLLRWLALAAALALPGTAPAGEGERHLLTIGTGGLTGVYYPTGGAICRLVNRGRPEHGIRCRVEATGGSLDNLEQLRDGRIDLAVVQSDWQYHAWGGSSRFADRGPWPELRALLSLHPEPFTVVVREASGVGAFEELRGRRVNIGNPGSGQRGTMDVVMQAMGWTTADFALASELVSTEQSKALCDDRIDAMVFTVGHPSGSIREATTSCESRIVSVEGAPIDRLVAEHPYYRHAVIPGGLYPGTERDVPTFGVGATFVGSTRLSEEVVYEMVRAILANLDDFKRLHPAFESLEPREMVRDGLSAPLHEGALRYYREAGLLP